MVSAESADCTICHEDLLDQRPVVHPPVADDCTICHEFAVEEEGTTVALMEAEPGLCVFCHDDLEKAVEEELEAPHFPVVDSCLNCHDPHASAEASLLAQAPPALCGECHDLDDLQEVHDGQLTPTVACVSCHRPHGSDNPRMLVASQKHAPFEAGSCRACHREPFAGRTRLRSRGERLCEACHGDVSESAGEEGSVHSPLKGERGRPGCLSCHSPHMSEHRSLLLTGRPALCAECHADVVEAALAETGHFAAADDCLNCHGPHASPNPSLLLEPRREVCEGCHDLEDEELSAVHQGAPLARLDCLGCHTPHGTGHDKLLARNVHAAIEDGCDLCHEGSYRDLAEGGGTELCAWCHDDVVEAAAAATVPHAALELGSCTDCHNPHASPQEKLVKAPGAGPCADCHDDKVAGPGEVAHSVIDLVGCRACHEPHGGEREKLLRVAGSELCLSCHQKAPRRTAPGADSVVLLDRFEVPASATEELGNVTLRPGLGGDHPLVGHRTLGVPTEAELGAIEVNFSGELSCLTCHDPHKGKSEGLFQGGAASTLEVCQKCHEK